VYIYIRTHNTGVSQHCLNKAVNASEKSKMQKNT